MVRGRADQGPSRVKRGKTENTVFRIIIIPPEALDTPHDSRCARLLQLVELTRLAGFDRIGPLRRDRQRSHAAPPPVKSDPVTLRAYIVAILEPSALKTPGPPPL